MKIINLFFVLGVLFYTSHNITAEGLIQQDAKYNGIKLACGSFSDPRCQ